MGVLAFLASNGSRGRAAPVPPIKKPILKKKAARDLTRAALSIDYFIAGVVAYLPVFTY
jgi:hypothetical protein